MDIFKNKTEPIAGVIGFPINHSLSPYIHNYWLNMYGIDGSYDAFEVSVENFKNFIESMKSEGISGVNVTIPHKESVMKIADFCDEAANFVGAANTVIVDDDCKIYARNTDVYGFVTNLKQNSSFDFDGKKAVVLGAGGAARAVCAGLLGSEINVSELTIINRTIERAEKVKEYIEKNIKDILERDGKKYEEAKEGIDHFVSRIKIERWEERENILGNIDILVNTTSLGMKGQPELDINIDNLPNSALVTDIVYNPIETTLLKNAKNKGNQIVDGIGMLLHQAAPAFEVFFGQKPEVTEDLRKYVLQKLL